MQALPLPTAAPAAAGRASTTTATSAARAHRYQVERPTRTPPPRTTSVAALYGRLPRLSTHRGHTWGRASPVPDRPGSGARPPRAGDPGGTRRRRGQITLRA